MGSFEIVDSGRFSGGRSNFSRTCSLLSQYLKEKGSFGDLTLGLAHNLEPKGAPTETKDLLPMIEKSGRSSGSGNLNTPPTRDETQNKSDLSSGTKPEAETAQMTIFYAGKVMVFDDLPAEKAKEIMMLASSAQNHPNPTVAPLQSPAESTTSVPNVVPHHCAQPPLDSDLPIARKNSLARFLEKRKDRITANAPYPASKAAAPAVAKAEAWLGLGPQLPLRIQRH
ncbi:UNVERIFIED_CONTAM: protein TIFY 10A [Sesamum latifolium]|uniref:Protein TIFY n=1 Tax=Sesamum latifolium TaxID=2727402 RepID=A0AAW2U046_9LAMI